MLGSLDDGQEVIASQLSDLAAEAHAAIGKQDLGLANAAGVEEELTRDGVARRILVAKAEIKPKVPLIGLVVSFPSSQKALQRLYVENTVKQRGNRK